MDALVTFLSRNHHNVIIEGVESEAHKNGAGNGVVCYSGTTGRKSVLNNWSKKISHLKNAGNSGNIFAQ
jgi:hypothetical protein